MRAKRKTTSVLLLSLLFLLAACAPGLRTGEPVAVTDAQERSPAPAGPPPGLTVDPAIDVGTLANGLTYYIRTNGKPEERAELWLVVNAGSVLEDDDQRGLAHFVEHMAFNGTRHFKKQEIIDYMELIGMRFGPDVNAYTSFDETVYMLRVPTDDLETMEKAFLILEDWAQAVSFEPEEIDKERGVVLEERRLGRGAGARMRDEQFPVLFRGSRYAERLTIGDEEILRSAPHEALTRFYRDWYRPDLMAVIAVGDFDPAWVAEKIKGHFGGLRPPAEPRERIEFPVPDHEETLVTVATDPEATSTFGGVYYKLERRGNRSEADFRRMTAERLYHGMLNSRLDELRQEAAPPFLYAYSSSGSFVRTRDIYFQGAAVEEGGLERGIDVLLTEVERVDRHGFTQTELERARKELLRFYEQAYLERDKSESDRLAGEIVRHFLTGELMPGIEVELELARRFVPEIGLEEINRLAREWISERNRVIMVQAPEKEGAGTPSEESLLAVFNDVDGKEIGPYDDRVRQGPLVAQKPTPGKIVEQTAIDEIGVTAWKLANGVRVMLKPTDFKNDEILLTAFSPGGHSLAEDEQYVSAAYASSVIGVGGLGEFSQVELQKALAGKIASASVYVGELEENARGNASPEDLETMFELLYLSLTAPRRDEQAFRSWLSRSRGFIENRLARPETVFSDRMLLALYQDHPRRQPSSVERLDQIDLDAALEFYRGRFADLGDFTFVLVGNFTIDGIKPLVLTYLGGLPSGGRVETWRDIGVRTPTGVEKVEVSKGLEPKSQVRIVFTGAAEWTRQLQHDISSLATALRIRLREVLREDMGGTYGVGVSGSISRLPRTEYRFSISFGCGPENVEDMVRAVFDEIEAIKRDGIDGEVITKVKEGQTRSRETNLEQNGFWMNVLASYYRHGVDPKLILAYDELVDSVSSERLRAAARRHLDTGRYVLGVLMPEEPAGAP